MITPTLLARFSVPPCLSALRFKLSGHMIVAARLTLSLPASQQPLFLHQCLPQVPLSHAAPARYSDHAAAMKDKGYATPPLSCETYLTIAQSINSGMYIFFLMLITLSEVEAVEQKRVKTNLECSMFHVVLTSVYSALLG